MLILSLFDAEVNVWLLIEVDFASIKWDVLMWTTGIFKFRGGYSLVTPIANDTHHDLRIATRDHLTVVARDQLLRSRSRTSVPPLLKAPTNFSGATRRVVKPKNKQKQEKLSPRVL
jgi:hypothetical protein